MWFSLCMLLHSSISALSSVSNCFQLPTFSWSACTQQPVYQDLISECSPLPAREVTQCPSYLGEQTTQSLFRSSQLWCFEPCVPKTVEAHILPCSLPASAESSFYLPTPKRLILFHNKKNPKQTDNVLSPGSGNSCLNMGPLHWEEAKLAGSSLAMNPPFLAPHTAPEEARWMFVEAMAKRLWDPVCWNSGRIIAAKGNFSAKSHCARGFILQPCKDFALLVPFSLTAWELRKRWQDCHGKWALSSSALPGRSSAALRRPAYVKATGLHPTPP